MRTMPSHVWDRKLREIKTPKLTHLSPRKIFCENTRFTTLYVLLSYIGCQQQQTVYKETEVESEGDKMWICAVPVALSICSNLTAATDKTSVNNYLTIKRILKETRLSYKFSTELGGLATKISLIFQYT